MDIRVGIIFNNKNRLLLYLKRHARLTKMLRSIGGIDNGVQQVTTEILVSGIL